MRIAVTGATGFIGKNLLKAAESGNQYLCLTRGCSTEGLAEAENIHFTTVDFHSPSGLAAALQGIDVVIHMIGRMGGYGVPLDSLEDVNCRLTENMVNASITAGVGQFIYISTPGVQGFGKRLCLESEPYAPRNAYEQTKARAEQIVIQKLMPSPVKYTILRPDFVYGPEDTRRIKMYKNICSGRFILTTSGSSHLHPTHVSDVVQGIARTAGNPCAYNEIFNISAEHDITAEEYLNTIADYFGVPLIHINIGYKTSVFLASIIEGFCSTVFKKEAFVSRNKIDFLALDHSTSNRKAVQRLGYCPKFDFKEGFADTMGWCKANRLI